MNGNQQVRSSVTHIGLARPGRSRPSSGSLSNRCAISKIPDPPLDVLVRRAPGPTKPVVESARTGAQPAGGQSVAYLWWWSRRCCAPLSQTASECGPRGSTTCAAFACPSYHDSAGGRTVIPPRKDVGCALRSWPRWTQRVAILVCDVAPGVLNFFADHGLGERTGFFAPRAPIDRREMVRHFRPLPRHPAPSSWHREVRGLNFAKFPLGS